MRKDLRIRATLLCAVAVGALASPALAQDAPAASTVQDQSTHADKGGSALSGEIIVTAQRREQSIQKVGIAITAFSGDQLRALNVTDSPQIAAITPGVHIGGALGGQNSQYTIRGVTQNDFSDITEAPNAVYLDDGYIAIGQGQTFALFDIDRVEVLKGPQGTLFGRNATGGLVRYISRKPNLDKVEGFVDVNYGMYDSPGSPGAFHGEAAINLPISSTLATRFAVMWNKAQGYVRNRYPLDAVGGSPGPGAGANLGDDNTLAGRMTTLFEPNDGVRVLLSVNGARTIQATSPYQSKPTIGVFNAGGEQINTINASPTETRAAIGANGQDYGSDLNNDGVFGDSFGRAAAGGDFFGYKDPDGSGPLTSQDFSFRKGNHIRTWGVNLNGEFDLSDGVTLASVTDYKHFFKFSLLDIEGSPTNLVGGYNGVSAYTFSQEVRLTGKSDLVDWTGGLYYLHITSRSNSALRFPPGGVASTPAPFDVGVDANLITNSYSAFGQLDWHIAPRLTLITGARIIREQKKYDFFHGIWPVQTALQPQSGTPIVIGPVFGPNGPMPYADKSGKTLWAGKVQLDFQVNPDLLLYAGVNRGVKAGSYNATNPGGAYPVPLSLIPYKPEILTNYEGGFKYTFPDQATRFNASVYYYDYKNYQAFLFAGVGGVVINADDRTYGGEASLATSPVRGLDVGLSVSYFDAKVKDVPLRAGGPIVRDVKPVYAPPLQGNAFVRYEWQAFGGKLSVQSDASYTDPFYYNLRNFDGDKFGRAVMVNAGIGWSNDNWELNFRVKNLTNVNPGVVGFDLATLCGCNAVSYKPPRFFQLGARYNF
jgi:iron complex outermembrane recepter protein